MNENSPALDAIPALLTLDDVATVLRCNRRTVERLVASGELATVFFGRLRRVTPDDLAVFVAGHRQSGTDAA